MGSQLRQPIPPFEVAQESHAQWLPAQEMYFIDLMVKKVAARGGHGFFGVFSKDEWLDIRKKYYERFTLKHDLKQFKNKFSLLKERYKEFKRLVEENTELGWDPVLRTVAAPPEWWNKYLKTHPKAKRFRSQGCPEYEKLCVIFGDTNATGHLAGMSNHDSSSTDGDDSLNEDVPETVPVTLLPPCPMEGQTRATSPGEHEGRRAQPSIRSRDSTPSRPRARNVCHSSEFVDALKTLAEASRARLELSKKNSISECMDILDSMGEGIGVRAYMEAVEKFRDKGWREIFLKFTDERRKQWLQHLGEHSKVVQVTVNL